MDYRLLAHSLYLTYRIAVSEFSFGDVLPVPVAGEEELTALVKSDPELIGWLQECLQTGEPEIYFSNLRCMWVGIPYQKRVLALGPVLVAAVSREHIAALLKSAISNPEEITEISRATASLPVISYLEMMRVSSLLCRLLNGELQDAPNFRQYRGVSTIAITDDGAYESQLRDFSASRRTERFLLQCVENGDVARLGDLAMFEVPKLARVARDDLRRSKNIFITALAMVSRAAIGAGLPLEIAYPLSDEYMMKNETLTDAAQVWQLLQACTLDYTQRVADNRVRVQYGALIGKCRGYVLANVNGGLKISEIARALGVNHEYLSRRFKKETGESLLEFIHQATISEAKNLLRFSDLDVAQIAARLGYSSQSRFATQFKNLTGITPGRYRRDNT